MSATSTFPEVGTSQRKQLLYSKYALGELTLAQVSRQVGAVTPARHASRARVLSRVFVSVVAAFLLPSWATRRQD
jgi:hypothetical protein